MNVVRATLTGVNKRSGGDTSFRVPTSARPQVTAPWLGGPYTGGFGDINWAPLGHVVGTGLVYELTAAMVWLRSTPAKERVRALPERTADRYATHRVLIAHKQEQTPVQLKTP